MKKLLSNPGFEIVFAFGLIVILGLPPVLLAQGQQEIEIRIENGDTVVNGKNIKDLSAKERMVALKDIKNLTAGKPGADSVKTDNGTHKFYLREHFSLRKDSLFAGGNKFGMSSGNDLRNRITVDMRRQGGPGMRGNRKNTQTFDFTVTDNEGISTRIKFLVAEVSNEDLKKMPHVEGGKFDVENLAIVPEFNSGSVSLMFNLLTKSPADVQFINSDGKTLWTEKVEGGKFSKTFGLGLNGTYFLQIKQGNFIAVKRIVKEE